MALDCGTVDVNAVDTEAHERIRHSTMAKLVVKPPGVRKKVTVRVKTDTGVTGR